MTDCALITRAVPGTDFRELVQDWRFWCHTKQVWVRVPAGFRWDGASIPRVFWPAVGHPFSAEFEKAAAAHDWNYWTERISRADADRDFRNTLLLSARFWHKNAIRRKLAVTRAWAMWSAVRVGGAAAWAWDADDASQFFLLEERIGHREDAEVFLSQFRRRPTAILPRYEVLG